jgi:hypothetical protein
MNSSKRMKPAAADTANGLQGIDQRLVTTTIDPTNNPKPVRLQAPDISGESDYDYFVARPDTIDHHESETADPLVAFRECAADFAWFYRSGLLVEKAHAVDCAQRHAELWGVVDVCGQDAVQAEIAAAFISAEQPDEIMATDCAAQILQRWEMADPRDQWKFTGETPPTEIIRNSDISAKPTNAPKYCTPQSTIDAFWYVVGLRDQERFKAWLADHPQDAPFLLKLMEGK